MTVNLALPFTSSAIMLAFVVAVLGRWWTRKQPYLLLWAIGLSMFGIASFAEAFSAVAWNGLVFRSWYLFGAMLTAAWIGQGTVYLLARRRAAHAALAVLLPLSVVGAYGVLALSLDAASFSKEASLADQYREIMPSGTWVRAMTPLFNIYGLIALVGGAVYSAWLFWRKQALPNRMWGNILIAVGALSIGFASTLTRLGYGGLLYLGEVVAAALMFAGFIVATQRVSQPILRTDHPQRNPCNNSCHMGRTTHRRLLALPKLLQDSGSVQDALVEVIDASVLVGGVDLVIGEAYARRGDG